MNEEKMIKSDTTKVTMNLPTDLVEKVKEYSKTIGVNVTSAFVFLLNKALEQDKMFDAVTAMVSFMKDFENKKSEKIKED